MDIGSKKIEKLLFFLIVNCRQREQTLGRPPPTQTKISFQYKSLFFLQLLEKRKDNDQLHSSIHVNNSLFEMWLQIQRALDISNIVGNCMSLCNVHFTHKQSPMRRLMAFSGHFFEFLCHISSNDS